MLHFQLICNLDIKMGIDITLEHRYVNQTANLITSNTYDKKVFAHKSI